MKRESVYKLIDGERAYQVEQWGSPEHKHEVGAWLTLLRAYLYKADIAWTENRGDEAALDIIRKIAGIAVACMEQHGAPHRKTRIELANETLLQFSGQRLTDTVLLKMNMAVAPHKCVVERDFRAECGYRVDDLLEFEKES